MAASCKSFGSDIIQSVDYSAARQVHDLLERLVFDLTWHTWYCLSFQKLSSEHDLACIGVFIRRHVGGMFEIADDHELCALVQAGATDLDYLDFELLKHFDMSLSLLRD